MTAPCSPMAGIALVLIFASSPLVNSSMPGSTEDRIALSREVTDGGAVFFSDRAQRPCGRFSVVAKTSRSMRSAMSETITPRRAELFRYVGLDLDGTTVRGTYEMDGRHFTKRWSLRASPPEHARRSLGGRTVVPPGGSFVLQDRCGPAHRRRSRHRSASRGRRLLEAALRDGLGEFSYHNDLPLDDVTIDGGGTDHRDPVSLDPKRVLVPFGGGIDSVVTVESLSPTSTHRSSS